jgi:hypothetical protein
MSYSNYVENKINDAVCRNSSLAIAAVYVKLHLADPGEDCTTSPAVETTRKVVTFAVSAAGVSVSNVDVDWTAVSTTETYTHASLWDASTAGNPLGSGALATPAAVVAGGNFKIPSGLLTFTSN